jgi:hypothetical protein
METTLPIEAFGEGISTGTLTAITSFLIYLVGPEVSTLCLAVAVAATLGQLAMYKSFREGHPVQERRSLLIGLLLVPSVVFWSSGVAKEAVALAFLGGLAASAYRFSRGSFFLGAIGAGLCGLGVAMLKPYILFPFILASAVWFYSSRRNKGSMALSPLYLGLAVALAVVGLAAMGSLFPEYGVSKVGETTALQQELGQQAGGSSYIEMGDPEAKSLAKQLRFVPLALINALFRPMMFEARNAPTFAAALESTLLTVFVIVIVWRFKWKKVRQVVAESPTLMFCVVFLFTFATAVGLATTNLGTLSRYRMPMMPFYATAVLLVYRRIRHGVPAMPEAAPEPWRKPVQPARRVASVARSRRPSRSST